MKSQKKSIKHFPEDKLRRLGLTDSKKDRSFSSTMKGDGVAELSEKAPTLSINEVYNKASGMNYYYNLGIWEADIYGAKDGF